MPYFGACIHTPPPPANQIIWVRLREPARGVGSFDVIEVALRISNLLETRILYERIKGQ